MKRIVIVCIALVCCGLAYWLISPLFIQRELTEDTTLTAEQQAGVAEAIEAFQGEEGSKEDATVAESTEMLKKEMENMEDVVVVESMLEVRNDIEESVKKVEEAPVQKDVTAADTETAEEAQVIASGEITSIAHDGTGKVKIISFGEGKDTILSLVDLAESNGPDLRVLLSKNTQIKSAQDLGEYIEIDKLKGNVGTQHYIVPDTVNPAEYKSVIIYCKPFRVVFNVAELSA